jgi:hypothetical protein
MFYLNRACEIQMAAAQMASVAGPVTEIPAHLSQHACEQLQSVEHERQICGKPGCVAWTGSILPTATEGHTHADPVDLQRDR